MNEPNLPLVEEFDALMETAWHATELEKSRAWAEQCRAFRARLSLPGLAIRPLVWEEVEPNIWEAKTIFGDMEARPHTLYKGEWVAAVYSGRDTKLERQPTKEAAIAACEAHYRSRLLPSLMPSEPSGGEGFAPAWNEVRRLIAANAKHRKGFRLNDHKVTPHFIVEQADSELGELALALVDRSEHGEVLDELADVLGVLFHLAHKLGFTPEEITTAMLAKFRERFSLPTPIAAPSDGEERG